MTGMRARAFLVVLLAAVLGLAGPGFGQTAYLWMAPAGGFYGTTANWAPIGVPSAADYAEFEISGAYTVSFDGYYTASYLDVGRGQVTFDLRGYTYNLPDAWSASITNAAESPRLTVTNGVVESLDIHIADTSGTSDRGELVISAGARWSAFRNPLVVGGLGQGKLTVEKGGTMEHGHGWAGPQAGSRGDILVTDFGSLWNCTGYYSLGWDGDASLTVQNGAAATTGACEMAYAGISQATAIIDGTGSRWDIMDPSGGLSIGISGSASVIVRNGGQLNSAGEIRLGENSDGTGSLTVTGLGSRVSCGGLLIGVEGQGYLTVSGGGELVSQISIVGLAAPSLGRGSVMVDGAGSKWTTVGDLYVGGNGAMPGGGGDLTVTGGGRVNVGGFMQVSSVGTVELRDGKISAGSVQVDSGGLVQIEKGTFDAPGGFVNDGTIQMLSPLAKITANTLMSNNFLGGRGNIVADFINGDEGIVVMEAGETLNFHGASHTNNGLISLLGGTLLMRGTLQNNSTISGQGTVAISGGVTNDWKITFSGGESEFIGDLTNLPGATVRVTGGSTATFQGDVHNDGLVWVRPDSIAVFLGMVHGTGNYDGGGTFWMEGGFSPGDSPAAVDVNGDLALGPQATLVMELGGLTPGSQYDQLNISGDLAADGTLAVNLLGGFTPLAGQEFDILNFDSLDGAFDSISLPALGSGLSWDTSALYTTGSIGVVPEPATLALLGLGVAVGLGRRRRGPAGRL
jgi:T5SS/PEP-CTERM-associated repeat protein